MSLYTRVHVATLYPYNDQLLCALLLALQYHEPSSWNTQTSIVANFHEVDSGTFRFDHAVAH